jgi:hypothetical protein
VAVPPARCPPAVNGINHAPRKGHPNLLTSHEAPQHACDAPDYAPRPPAPTSLVHSPRNRVAQSVSLAISALYSLPGGRWCRQTYHCTFCRESVLAHAHASLTHPRTLSLILRSLSHSFSLPPLILSRPPAISLEQACLCLCPHISLSLARARSLAHACYDNVIKQLF